MRSIVSFSGGLDSIYVLWKELTETSNDVLAVYFMTPGIPMDLVDKYQIKGFSNQAHSFEIATKLLSVSEEMSSNIRSFEFISVYYDLSLLVDPKAGSNFASVLRVKWAIDRINKGQADRFVSGQCRDNDGFSVGADTTKSSETSSSLSMDVFLNMATRGEYALPLMDSEYTIANAYAEMPQNLIDLSLSCESQPACGVCYKCLMHQLAKNKLADGMSKEQYFEFVMSKSILKPNLWRSQKKWLSEEIPSYITNVKDDWNMPKWGHSVKIGE